MIPEFVKDGQQAGLLPEGIHNCSRQEFIERFGYTKRRRKLIGGLAKLITHLKSVGSKQIFIDGSFVTSKEVPGDYDACFDLSGVKIERLDPVLIDFSEKGKEEMERKYGGDIRPSQCEPVELEIPYLEFFQIGRDGQRKGIVRLNVQEWCDDQERQTT